MADLSHLDKGEDKSLQTTQKVATILANKSGRASSPIFLYHYNILYYTILYYTILYYTILYYIILYYTILYYTILYYIFRFLTNLHLKIKKSKTAESP